MQRFGYESGRAPCAAGTLHLPHEGGRPRMKILKATSLYRVRADLDIEAKLVPLTDDLLPKIRRVGGRNDAMPEVAARPAADRRGLWADVSTVPTCGATVALVICGG